MSTLAFPLVVSAAVAAVASFFLIRVGILLAPRWKLMDYPTARRRHPVPIPIIGGLTVFLSWFCGIAAFSCLQPRWMDEHLLSVLILGGSVAFLSVMGLVDDLNNLSPKTKLIFQFVLAGIVLAFEPQIHWLCQQWQITVGPIVWPVALLWIVGVCNAVNLIDGLDGLATGTSLLATSSLLILSIWSGADAQFATLALAALIGPLAVFGFFNWAPARIFLGDNGSLPLGFLIASLSLMCRPQNKSWIMLASLVLMLGYPILDTSLAVWRRLIKRLPLFKADRNHLHHRVLRLGLSVGSACGLLLSITVYLQVAAVCINFMSVASAALSITVVCFSVCSLLFLVRGIERWRVLRLYSAMERNRQARESEGAATISRVHQVMVIELEPLLEAGMSEESSRYQLLVSALLLMLQTSVREGDLCMMSDQQINIIFQNLEDQDAIRQLVKNTFQKKIGDFLTLYNLQCSLSSLPVHFEKRQLISLDTQPSLLAGRQKKSHLRRIS